MPASPALQIAARSAFEPERTFRARYFEREAQLVRQAASPRVVAHSAKPVRVARFQFLDALDERPPLGPGRRIVDDVPDSFERCVELPDAGEAVFGHGDCALLERETVDCRAP